MESEKHSGVIWVGSLEHARLLAHLKAHMPPVILAQEHEVRDLAVSAGELQNIIVDVPGFPRALNRHERRKRDALDRKWKEK